MLYQKLLSKLAKGLPEPNFESDYFEAESYTLICDKNVIWEGKRKELIKASYGLENQCVLLNTQTECFFCGKDFTSIEKLKVHYACSHFEHKFSQANIKLEDNVSYMPVIFCQKLTDQNEQLSLV
jgi:hypothetical protein